MYRAVFVYYPRGVRTGGPEALHQLAHGLIQNGLPTYLVPTPETCEARDVDAYRRYNVPIATSVEDAPDTAVVVGEQDRAHVRGIRFATKYLWWLSIDNSEFFRSERKLTYIDRNGLRNRAVRFKHFALLPVATAKRRSSGLDGFIHLAQSQYAWSFVYSRLNFLPSLVTDYTVVGERPATPDHPVVAHALSRSGRPAGRPVVAYTPSRGGALVSAVRDRFEGSLGCDWLPIEGMTPQQVSDSLASSTVYLDLGHHPGKDRLPREAAVSGAVTLVARRGSASYSADVPVPAEHKVDMSSPIEDAGRALRAVLADPHQAWSRQSLYRDVVLGERSRFLREVANVFCNGKLGDDTGPCIQQFESS